MKKRKSGFTLVEIMIVVAIIGLLAAIGIPALRNAFSTSADNAKKRNIVEVEKAKGRYAVDNNITTDTTLFFSDIQGYLQGVSAAADLDVAGESLTVGSVGSAASTIASYN